MSAKGDAQLLVTAGIFAWAIVLASVSIFLTGYVNQNVGRMLSESYGQYEAAAYGYDYLSDGDNFHRDGNWGEDVIFLNVKAPGSIESDEIKECPFTPRLNFYDSSNLNYICAITVEENE